MAKSRMRMGVAEKVGNQGVEKNRGIFKGDEAAIDQS